MFKQESVGIFIINLLGAEKQEYEEWIHEAFINFGPLSVNIPGNIMEDINKKLKKNVQSKLIKLGQFSV